MVGAERNKAREAKRGSLLTSSAKKKRGKREKKIKRKEEGAACSPIRCFCLFVMLEHPSEQGFVGWGGLLFAAPLLQLPTGTWEKLAPGAFFSPETFQFPSLGGVRVFVL